MAIKLKNLLTTINTMTKILPSYYNDIKIDYMHLWTEVDRNEYDENDTNDLIEESKNKTIDWLESTSEEDINEVIKSIPPAARQIFIEILPDEYSKFYRFDFLEMPNELVTPTPFLCASMKHYGEFPKINKPLKLQYGQTLLIVKGIALYAEDGKTTAALIKLRNKKKCKYTNKNISFYTTITEIAKTLRKKNPHAESTQNAIWKSLERLRGVVITIIGENGKRKLGGIIDGAWELDEDSNLNVEIFLDRNFIELLGGDITSANPDNFKLPPKPYNLLMFLRRQQIFNTKGILNPKNGYGIEKIYNYAGLGGLNPEKKRMCEKRKEIKSALTVLEKEKEINKWRIDKNDKLFIYKSEQNRAEPEPEQDVFEEDESPAPRKKQKRKRTKTNKMKCPYDHEFGKDHDEKDDCLECHLEYYAKFMDCETEYYTKFTECEGEAEIDDGIIPY